MATDSRSSSRFPRSLPSLSEPLSSGLKKVRGKKSRAESYKIYLYRVLKQLHGNLKVSKTSMSILNTFVNHRKYLHTAWFQTIKQNLSLTRTLDATSFPSLSLPLFPLPLAAFEKIVTTAKQLAQISNLNSITSREIQSAVYLVVPGDLAKHAVTEGRKAVEMYAPESREDRGLNREAAVEGTKAVTKVSSAGAS